MVWTFLCSKIALLPSPIAESNRACMSEVFFFHKLLFGEIKLSDLERDVGTESCLPMTALIISKLYCLPITATKHET